MESLGDKSRFNTLRLVKDKFIRDFHHEGKSNSSNSKPFIEGYKIKFHVHNIIFLPVLDGLLVDVYVRLDPKVVENVPQVHAWSDQAQA